MRSWSCQAFSRVDSPQAPKIREYSGKDWKDFFCLVKKNPGKQKEHMKIVADYLTSFLGGNIWGSYLTHCPIYFFVWGGEVEQCKGRSRCWFDITSKFQLTWDIDIEEVAVFWASIPVPCSTWECVFLHWSLLVFFWRCIYIATLLVWYCGSDLEPGMMYFSTRWGAKEPQYPQNRTID